MAFKYGLQEKGFTYTPKDTTQFSQALYDQNFDFEKFDINYNPWGEGPDAYAQKQAFEESLKTNSVDVAHDYNRLQHKAEGYQYIELGTRGNDGLVTLGDNLSTRELGGGRMAFEQGYKEGDTFVKQTQGWGRDSYDKYVKVNIGGSGFGGKDRSHSEAYAENARNRGDRTVRVAGEQLTGVEEYKKWRYDVAASQIDGSLGQGENELYTGLGYLGTNVDKTTTMQAYSGASGPETAVRVGRAERQAGASAFKRRDIFNRSRTVQANLGEQRAARARGANVGNNQSSGIQLGG